MELFGSDGWDLIRNSLVSKGASEESLSIILSSLSKNTWKQYLPVFENWKAFCKSTNKDPLFCNVELLTQFLSKLYRDGKSYSAINISKSALSLLLSDENHSVGGHPIINRFLKGVAKSRPPAPRYNTTWDPQVVLDFYKCQPDNSELTLPNLSRKCITLLAIGTAHRVQTFSVLKRSNVNYCDSKMEIFVPDIIKTSKPGRPQPNLILPLFSEEPKVCLMRTMISYLERSALLKSPSCDSIFISFTKPYKPVGAQTLSRWIKEALASCKIDVGIFSAHSCRHAATSAAHRKGVSVEMIRSRAGWTNNSSTFCKFYDRPLLDQNEFANAIFT